MSGGARVAERENPSRADRVADVVPIGVASRYRPRGLGEQLVTKQQFADEMAYSTKQVERWMKLPGFPAEKHGPHRNSPVRIRLFAARQWVAEHVARPAR